MSKNEEKDFDNNLKEIKELSKRLQEPLEEPITILYFDQKQEKIKYKGRLVDDKYAGLGILYNENGEGIKYNGYFSNNEYNGFGNEYINNKLNYEGYFENGKKHGKGLLYYNNNEKIYFNGIFDMDNYIEGVLYDPDGNKIYEGIFKNNRPKEGKNIKLYNLNGELEYKGDLLDSLFHGYGILYEKGKYEENRIFSEYKYLKYEGEFKENDYNGFGKLYIDHYLGKYLLYEGNFKNNLFYGNGKIYYQNKNICYDGEFSSNKLNGKGIKYYKNGKIKIKGLFEDNKCIEGEYYNPDGLNIYKGEFMNDIPKEAQNIIIYDDNTNKKYEGEIHNGNYEGEGIEYDSLIKNKILFQGNFKDKHNWNRQNGCVF